MSSEPNGIMNRLRTETHDLHAEAESRPLERAMLEGTLPRPLFIAWLTQRLAVHTALEQALDSLRRANARVARLVTDEQYQRENILADLESFGVGPDIDPPNNASKAAVEKISEWGRESPLRVLGAHYVFEGSKNGARFIARGITGAYRLPAPPRYLDPHGENQKPLWDAFKRTMDELEFTEQEQDEIVAGARDAFAWVSRQDDELYAGAADAKLPS